MDFMSTTFCRQVETVMMGLMIRGCTELNVPCFQFNALGPSSCVRRVQLPVRPSMRTVFMAMSVSLTHTSDVLILTVNSVQSTTRSVLECLETPRGTWSLTPPTAPGSTPARGTAGAAGSQTSWTVRPPRASIGGTININYNEWRENNE